MVSPLQYSPTKIHTLSLPTQSQKLLPAAQISKERSQTVPGWDSMASNNDHQNPSGSSNPAHEILRRIIIDIEGEPEDLDTTEWSIYKVPRNLWTLNKPAYTPQLVSIGPLHYGRIKLKPMQKHKIRYLDHFCRRAGNNIKPLDGFKTYLISNENRIRQCYAEKLDIDDEKLVEIMFLDSVFIMELFLRVREKQTDPDDFILKQSWLNKSIERDLLLLENQIPLFILQKLYTKFVPASNPVKTAHPNFVDLARHYFDSSIGGYEKGDFSSCETLNNELKHFTDLIRSFYICRRFGDVSRGGTACTPVDSAASPNFQKNRPFCGWTRLPQPSDSPSRTGTKLREAGVSFEKVKNRPLLNIKFKKAPILSWFLCLGCIRHSTYFKARLEIPQLKIDCTTECVLRNLIALEQCHYPNQTYICNYVSFIDSLIHTKDDVELLVEKEVIVHELGSDKEVATLVNGLCKHVVADKRCYRKLVHDLNEHYQKQWNRAMAVLRLVYFRDAWRASSTVAAIVVLVFTIFNFWRVVRLVFDLQGGYKKP